MIQSIGFEQTFVTNLEQFMSKADEFIKIYYSGMGEESHLKEMILLVNNLAMDTDLQQLKIDNQKYCSCRDLITDSNN